MMDRSGNKNMSYHQLFFPNASPSVPCLLIYRPPPIVIPSIAASSIPVGFDEIKLSTVKF